MLGSESSTLLWLMVSKVPGNESSTSFSIHGMKVPGSESSTYRTFAHRNVCKGNKSSIIPPGIVELIHKLL